MYVIGLQIRRERVYRVVGPESNEHETSWRLESRQTNVFIVKSQ